MLTAHSTLKRALLPFAIASMALLLGACASREERIQKLQTEANAALFDNQSEKAIQLLSEGLDRYPDSNELRIALSRAYQNAGRLSDAVILLELAVEQDPESDHLWVKVGELYSVLGESDKALAALDNYLKNHAEDFLAWKTVALENKKLGKLTDAIKAATRWNDITPSSQPALMLGELYLESRNIPQARSWLSQAAAYGDDGAAKAALAELVRLETSLKQFQQAKVWMDQYRQRYGTDLSDPRIRESKTVLDNWDRARREIAEAAAELERERNDLEAKRLEEEQAEAQRQADELAAALTVANDTSAPENQNAGAQGADADPAVERAPLSLVDDNDSPALTGPENNPVFEEPETDAESDPTELTPFEVAMSDYENSDFDSAIEQFWNLLGEQPDNPEIWYRLSLSYFAQANWFDAEATILEAKRRAPRSEVIANQYLLTIRNTQNTNRVLEEGKALRRLFPNSPAIALTLAQTLRNANAPRSIVGAAYSDFLAIAPRGEPGYQEANQYLQNGN